MSLEGFDLNMYEKGNAKPFARIMYRTLKSLVQ